MLGNLIGITTSIATTAAIGVTRAGLNAAMGSGRRMPVRTIRRTVIETNRDSVARLVAALDAEKSRSLQLERENARMRERLQVAEEAFEILMQERPDGSTR